MKSEFWVESRPSHCLVLTVHSPLVNIVWALLWAFIDAVIIIIIILMQEILKCYNILSGNYRRRCLCVQAISRGDDFQLLRIILVSSKSIENPLQFSPIYLRLRNIYNGIHMAAAPSQEGLVSSGSNNYILITTW